MDNSIKLAILEYAKLKFEMAIFSIVTGIMWAGTALTESSGLETLAGSLTGALLMGFAFAKLSNPPNVKALAGRVAVNFCFGVPLGVFLSYQYHELFPKIPVWAFSAITSGFSGALFVVLIPICIPFIAVMVRMVMEQKRKELSEAMNLALPSDKATATTSSSSSAGTPVTDGSGKPENVPQTHA